MIKDENEELKRPVLSSILVMLGLVVVMFIAGMVSAVTVFASDITFFIAFSFVAFIELIYMVRKRKFVLYGFKNWSMNKISIIYFLPLFFLAIVPLLGGFNAELKVSNYIYIISYMLIVAFVEEVLYRGIILNNLKQKSISYAVIGSSIMFGFSHLITAAGGKSLIDVIYQVVMAIVVGLILGLIIVYTNNIYICIGYHFLNNVFVSISGSFGSNDQLISYILLLVLVVYLFVLKNRLENVKGLASLD